QPVRKQNGAAVATCRISRIRSVIRSKCATRNFPPKRRQRIELPSRAAQPHSLDARRAPDRDQASTAEALGILLLYVMKEHTSPRDHRVAAVAFILSAPRCKMRQVIRKLILDVVARRIVKRVLQKGAWNSRVLVIQWNKRIPCTHGDFHRNCGIGERDLANRIFPAKFALRKSRETLEPSAPVAFTLEPLIVDLECRERTFHQPGNSRCTLDMKNCKSRFRTRKSFRQRGGRRMIPDREVLQAAISVQTNAAGTNSAHRHRDLRGSLPTEFSR